MKLLHLRTIYHLQSQFDITEETMHKKSAYIKVLGYKWKKTRRQFEIWIAEWYVDKSKIVTKKEVLKLVEKLNDPIIILNCFILTTRILMPEIWKVRLNYEKNLNEDMYNKWTNWCKFLLKCKYC